MVSPGTAAPTNTEHKMTHADAIAALILTDLADTNQDLVGRIIEDGYDFANLRGPLRRTERRGFAHGDTVRECMSSRKRGHGFAFAPVHALTRAERQQVVAALIAAGFAATLKRVSGCYRIVFA